MSTVLISNYSDKHKHTISVNRFSRGQAGLGYQVTWGVDQWAQFTSVHEAQQFVTFLESAIALA